MNKCEEWNRREEWNEKIKKLKILRNPISPVKTPPGTTKVPAKPIQNTSLFEENSGQSFRSDEVEKEVKDIGFKGAIFTGSEVIDGYGGENLPQTDNILKNLNSEDISTCIRSPESTNNQENRITIGAGDQSGIPEKDVPSHGPRKQQLGGLILGAEVEIPVRASGLLDLGCYKVVFASSRVLGGKKVHASVLRYGDFWCRMQHSKGKFCCSYIINVAKSIVSALPSIKVLIQPESEVNTA
ncbi:hypothetical protein Tco_0854485 [Tanacetum coccineum]